MVCVESRLRSGIFHRSQPEKPTGAASGEGRSRMHFCPTSTNHWWTISENGKLPVAERPWAEERRHDSERGELQQAGHIRTQRIPPHTKLCRRHPRAFGQPDSMPTVFEIADLNTASHPAICRLLLLYPFIRPFDA